MRGPEELAPCAGLVAGGLVERLAKAFELRPRLGQALLRLVDARRWRSSRPAVGIESATRWAVGLSARRSRS